LTLRHVMTSQKICQAGNLRNTRNGARKSGIAAGVPQ